MPEMTDTYQWQGRTMFGSDGEKIGKITQIYEDATTGKPEWATVSSGMFATKRNFVPLVGASPDGKDVRATVTKGQVKDAPGIDADGELSESEERRLFEHYGVPYTTDGSTTAQGPPSGVQSTSRGEDDATSERNTGEALPRSDEAGVGTPPREPGGPRLVKRVVTETVTESVPASNEEGRVVEKTVVTTEHVQTGTEMNGEQGQATEGVRRVQITPDGPERGER